LKATENTLSETKLLSASSYILRMGDLDAARANETVWRKSKIEQRVPNMRQLARIGHRGFTKGL
jgi:hypothetical protein